MPLRPRTFQEIFNILRDRIKQDYSDADFAEGSYNDLFLGTASLMYQEFQAYVLDLFRKTWFNNPQNTGSDLEDLAIDHYHDGASRPGATKAFGTVTITREGGNTDQIDVSIGDEFSVGENKYLSLEAVTILAGSNSGSVILEAEEVGESGNLQANQEWSTDIQNVTVTNVEPFQGGAEEPNDEEYRTFIENFVRSIQGGTKQGLEGTALLVPGVSSARLISKLVDVGTLNSAGALASGGDLFRFKAIRMLLYIGGLTGQVNSAIRNLVEREVKKQLSAGEFLAVVSATPIEINWSVDLTFMSSSQALALSQKRAELKAAFEEAINDLNVGENFVRNTVALSVINDNNWSGLFTIATNIPSGDVVIGENQKAVAGTVTIEVS